MVYNVGGEDRNRDRGRDRDRDNGRDSDRARDKKGTDAGLEVGIGTATDGDRGSSGPLLHACPAVQGGEPAGCRVEMDAGGGRGGGGGNGLGRREGMGWDGGEVRGE